MNQGPVIWSTAGPWLLTRGMEQSDYPPQSIAGHRDASWLTHLIYYP